MDEVFININHTGLEEHFKKDYVSIDELVRLYQDLESEIYILKEKIENLESNDEEDPDSYDKWKEMKQYYE